MGDYIFFNTQSNTVSVIRLYDLKISHLPKYDNTDNDSVNEDTTGL